MNMFQNKLHLLSTGVPVTSLSPYSNPFQEYKVAFEDREQPFLEYYSFAGKLVKKRTLTRGEFWNLACSGARYLSDNGVAKGDRLLHCFSCNNLYDPVFRLASVLVGCVPVTVNWQADDNERIAAKAKITGAKFIIFDEEFASRIEAIRSKSRIKAALEAGKLESYGNMSTWEPPALNQDDEKIIIFTSGTTGEPKGVSLSYGNYLANKLTFEQYFGVSETTQLDILLVNPLHHTNSTAFLDWAMRRGGTKIHLLQRYSTLYWKILVDVARQKRDLLIAPMVSRHIDFLEELHNRSELPVEVDEIKSALSATDMMIGSAPVGPTTIKRVLTFSDHLPIVRFGSTETCLQVMATPRTLSQNELAKAFEAGWSHCYQGESTVGYYIGRDHPPFTRIQAVRSIDPGSKGYLQPCDVGEPGYLVTQGPNIMSSYVGDDEAAESVFREGWYTGLRDIVFALENEADGQLDYYWVTRDSALLIRSGANYSYDQVAAELSKVLIEDFDLKTEQFKLSVIGLRVESEHEDSCCVTIELSPEVVDKQRELEADFINKARARVRKGFWPDYVRFAEIPTNFKGLVLLPELRQDYRQSLEAKGLTIYNT
ncbi:MAG: acyl--CoA ligase [Chloroflexi bacterium]|nr:acyl--CoA ligase [Chloroflexota bacterium]